MTTPSRREDDIVYLIARTPLGRTLVAASRRGVCMLAFADEPRTLLADLHRRFKGATAATPRHPSMPWLRKALKLPTAPWTNATFPLDLRGTPFQKTVWRALQRIGAGQTASYRDIARMIAAPTASRAVAGACGANPVSIAVPCHRIVRSDGSLSGYRWGLSRKRSLLDLEARHASKSRSR